MGDKKDVDNKEPVKKNVLDDVWDESGEFVSKSLIYNETIGDYYFHREISKKEEKMFSKPVSKYTPKEANSKKNKYKSKISAKLNDIDEEDYDYDNDYDESNVQYYKKK